MLFQIWFLLLARMMFLSLKICSQKENQKQQVEVCKIIDPTKLKEVHLRSQAKENWIENLILFDFDNTMNEFSMK